MRKHLTMVCVSVLGLASSPWAAAQQDINKLGWLAGCWQDQNGEAGSLEAWMPPAGGAMLGMSRTIRQGRTAEFEFMQMRQLPDGVLAFVPQPSGRPPTVFKLLRIGESEAVFEDSEHGFPQRIGYSRPEPDRLEAMLEGTRDGKPRRITFSFVRVSCDAQMGGAAP